jgi:5-methylcytosine-specific restriction endonuclease McrA
VRVHADAGADKLNRSLRSSAFTTGRDIFFRRGAYLPDSARGTALLAHEVTHVLQQGAAPAGMVQCTRPETFATYKAAEDANRYSRWWLSKQKNDPLERHIGKEFSPAERDDIYQANWHENDQELLSDSFPYQELFPPNTDETPHIDHRYPKADGGSNSFANAAVISAKANLSKGRRQTDLLGDPDPTEVLAPYQHLQQPPGAVGARMPFSEAQKALIYQANRAYYDTIYHDGELHSDLDGKPLFENDSSQVPHVDHITPRIQGGSNYYFNARIISREENIEKGGGDRPEIGFERDEGTFGYDDIELKMNLEEFIDYKAQGIYPARLVKWQPTAYEGSVASRTRSSKRLTTPTTPSSTVPKKTIGKEQRTQKTKKDKKKLQQKLQQKLKPSKK